VAGGVHNEANWSALLPAFFAFALDPWLEVHSLALELFPPALKLSDAVGGDLAVRYTARYGLSHVLQGAADPGGPWADEMTLAGPVDLWEDSQADVTLPGSTRKFWRLQMRSR
jgi:hypothetical protein